MVPTYRLAHIRDALGHLYEFEAYLGKGAFASVYLVRNRKLERLEALKILAEAHDGDHDFAIRFVAEAKMVASLDHPNIVKVYDYGEEDGVLWYSMQYIDGPVLRRELEVRRRFSAEDAVVLAIPLLDALGYSHHHGIVHRDVKPGNILLDRRGRPYLMDFGIAKVKGSVFKTQTGSVMGTPAYVSPEQALGHEVDGRCDLYALGITLYEMLCGAPPFRASDPIQTLIQRLHNDPVPPGQRGVDLPEALDTAIMRSLERQPADRYQTARDLQAALLTIFPREVTSTPLSIMAPKVEPTRLDAKDGHDDSKPTILSAGRIQSGGTSTTSPALPETFRTVPVEAPPIASDPPVGRPPARSRAWWLGATVTATVVAALVVVGGLWFTADRSDAPTVESKLQEPPRVDPSAESARLDPEPPQGADIDQRIDEPRDSGSESEPITASNDVATEPEPAEPRPTAEQAPPPLAAPPPPRPASPAPPPVVRRPVSPPRVEQAVEPATESLAGCRGSEVVLKVQVGEQGEVVSTRSLTQAPDECLAAAVDAVGLYRFAPAVDYAGEPVAAPITLAIRFPDP